MVKIVVPNWIEDETLARLSAHGDVVTSGRRDPLAADELRAACAAAAALMAVMPESRDRPFLDR